MRIDRFGTCWQMAGIAIGVVLMTGFTSCTSAPQHPQDAAQKSNKGAANLQTFQGTIEDQLAQRISGSGAIPDAQFTVFPTDNLVIWDVGSIVDSGRTTDNLVDDEACKIAQPTPKPFNALNGSYSFSNDVQFNAGLDKAIGSLAKAGASFDNGSTIKLSLESAQVQLLSKDALAKLMASPSCGGHASSGPQFLVRGYVLAKRDYELTSKTKLGANVGVQQVANFNASWQAGDTTLSLVDKQPMELVVILSEFKREAEPPAGSQGLPGSSPPPPPPPFPKSGEPLPEQSLTVGNSANAGPVLTAVSQGTLIQAKAVQGRIYLQVDQADDANAGVALQQALQRNDYLAKHSIPVVQKIQRIPSRKMPNQVTVKYFDPANHQAADAVYQTVKAQYPNAISEYVRLPIPPSADQVEVWLAKKG